MKNEKYLNRYRISSNRLTGWDYTSEGIYFITICTQDHIPFFGEIHENKMYLSPLGEIANQYWIEIPDHFLNVILEKFVIMPNHIHGIIMITSSNSNTRDDTITQINVKTQHAASLRKLQPPKPSSLSAIVRSFKSAVTRWAKQNNYPNFTWQARFYDHIVRDEKSLERIREYIYLNPQQWLQDDYHPNQSP